MYTKRQKDIYADRKHETTGIEWLIAAYSFEYKNFAFLRIEVDFITANNMGVRGGSQPNPTRDNG